MEELQEQLLIAGKQKILNVKIQQSKVGVKTNPLKIHVLDALLKKIVVV